MPATKELLVRKDVQIASYISLFILFAAVTFGNGPLSHAIRIILKWTFLFVLKTSLAVISYSFIGLATTILICLFLRYITRYRRSREIRAQDTRSASSDPPNITLAFESTTENFFNAAQRSRAQPFVYPESEIIERQISELLDLVITHFIKNWYTSISKRALFPNAIEHVLRLAMITLKDTVSRMDVVGSVVRRCVPIITEHLHEVSRAEAQVRDNAPSLNIDALEHNSISDQFTKNCRGGRLHRAAQESEGQEASGLDKEEHLQVYLREVVELLLPSLLSPQDLSSKIVKILLREILACAVLLPAFDIISDPDFWNQLIVTQAHRAIQERARVKRFRHVLKEQTQDSLTHKKSKKRKPMRNLEKLMTSNEPKDWERLHRKIKKSQSLADVTRMRTEMLVLRNEMLAADYASDNGVHLDPTKKGKSDHHLIKAMNLLELKMASLSGNDKSSAASASTSNVSFDKTLSVGVSYLLQYLEQRSRSQLLDFWQRVIQVKLHSAEPMPNSQLQLLDSKVHLSKDDIAHLYYKYFDCPLLTITDSEKQLVRNYVCNEPDLYDIDSNEVVVSVARRAYRTLETEDFPAFKNTKLYFHMVADVGKSMDKRSSLSRSLSASALQALGTLTDLTSRNRSTTDLQELEHEYLGNETMGMLDTSEDAVLEALDDALHDSLTLSADTWASQPSPNPLLHSSPTSSYFPQSPNYTTLSSVQASKPIRSDVPSMTDLPITDLKTAEPGDLGIREQIDLLNKEISKRQASLGYIDSFLTRDIEESDRKTALKSRKETMRELETLVSQKKRYEFDDHSLFGRSTIQIDHTMIHRGPDGTEYTAYMVEVRRTAVDGTEAGWIIARRYSEFNELLSQLKLRFPHVASLDFPKKQLNRLKSVADTRRPILESFLRNLLKDEKICQSRELRTFLSQNNEHVMKRQHKSVIENILGMTDPREAFGRLFTMLGEGPEDPLRSSTNPDLRQVHPAPQDHHDEGLTSFTKPIVDLILEAFDLRERSKWIKKKAVVLVLQQILGGTIENRVRDSVRVYTEEGSLSQLIGTIISQVRELAARKERATGGGGGVAEKVVKTKAEKQRTMDLARETLRAYNPSYIPDTAANKVFRALQIRSLNQHLLGRLLDQLLAM